MYLMDYDAMSQGSYHGKMLIMDEEDEAFIWSDREVYFIFLV